MLVAAGHKVRVRVIIKIARNESGAFFCSRIVTGSCGVRSYEYSVRCPTHSHEHCQDGLDPNQIIPGQCFLSFANLVTGSSSINESRILSMKVVGENRR
jgi:hypothetical protein